jgi:hypothetical protein
MAEWDPTIYTFYINEVCSNKSIRDYVIKTRMIRVRKHLLLMIVPHTVIIADANKLLLSLYRLAAANFAEAMVLFSQLRGFIETAEVASSVSLNPWKRLANNYLPVEYLGDLKPYGETALAHESGSYRGDCLMQNTEGRTSLDTVPLIHEIFAQNN